MSEQNLTFLCDREHIIMMETSHFRQSTALIAHRYHPCMLAPDSHVPSPTTNQDHCASCQNKWDLAVTDMCPGGKMPNDVTFCQQLPTAQAGGGDAAMALSWLRCYQMAEYIQLANSLENNNKEMDKKDGHLTTQKICIICTSGRERQRGLYTVITWKG